MANTVDKVIKVAEGEVGYLEKSKLAYQKDKSVLDEKTRGAGSDNYTKYGRDMHSVYPSVMDFPAAWCDAFVDWCFYKAYGVSTAKSLIGGNFNDWTVASATMYNNKKALNTTPKKGAQVFFTKNGKIDGVYHTGLVYKVDGTYFYTIEGNTSGASGVVANGGGVASKKYNIASYKGKVLFGHPKYDMKTKADSKTDVKNTSSNTDKKTTSSSSSTTTTAKNDIKIEPAASFSKIISGSYKTTANLNMRVGAGTNKKIITVIPNNTSVTCYGYYTTVSGTKWYYITYKSYTGFVSSKYLKKK